MRLSFRGTGCAVDDVMGTRVWGGEETDQRGVGMSSSVDLKQDHVCFRTTYRG